MDIKNLNDKEKYSEWDQWDYDYWEMFRDIEDLTACEIRLAQIYLNMMKIDIDQKEVINFRATPLQFANMIVRFIRHMEFENPENFWGNFCQSIDDNI